MSHLGLVAVIAGAVVAGGLEFAAPASASEQVKPTSMAQAPTGVDRLVWLEQINHGASAPRVDNTVQHSR
jgi:hypothetical protein